MIGKLELYLTEVISGTRQGTISSFLKTILFLLSLPYKGIITIRNWAYDHEWFRQYQPPVPVVISVGNFIVGGSGKTPVTMMIAQALQGEACYGILSRGYRSPAEKLQNPLTVCAGKGPLHSAAYCGDEPYLLAKNLPDAYIFVGRDRRKSANLAAKSGVDILILDDGMQHRRLGRDYEIVIVDVEDPLGQGHFLPRGFLRDDPKSLSRADLIILNNGKNEQQLEQAKGMIAQYSKAPTVTTSLDVSHLYDLKGDEVESIQGKRVVIFSGIAKPHRLNETVEQLGVEILGHEVFPDHHNYRPEDILRIVKQYQSKGVQYLICTEKDKVKLPQIPELKIPIVWLSVQLKIREGEEFWTAFLNSVKSDLAECKGENSCV